MARSLRRSLLRPLTFPDNDTRSIQFMPRKNKRSAPRRLGRKKQQPRKRNRNKKRRTPAKTAYMQMLANPCDAPLHQGLYTSQTGILSPLKTVFQSGRNETSGFLLWFPQFATLAPLNTDYETGNCFLFVNNDPASRPSNTATSPFGSSLDTSVTGTTVECGAQNFVKNDSLSDFREVGACIKCRYTGPLQDAKGVIAPITNISVDALLYGSGFTNLPANVNELVQMSSHVERVGLDTIEVRSRPSLSEMSWANEFTTPMLVGVPPNAATTLSSSNTPATTTCIGFVWNGITTNQLMFEFTQNIEWRPDVSSGFAPSPVRQLSTMPHLRRALAALDERYPGWQTYTSQVMQSALSRLVQAVWTGYRGRPHQRLLR